MPPALMRGPEAMPSLGVVEEVAGELGVVLWRCVRDVVLWASTPPSRRGGLFAGAAAERRARQVDALGVDAELLAPLSVLVRMLESPTTTAEPQLLNACRRLALWAEQRGHLATALEFLQAAARVAPESAALAFGVGRLARRLAEYDRAESWYARAIVQARRGREHGVYARAYSGLGNLYFQRGNYPAAKRAYLRCLKAALRYANAGLQGNAYHDLFAIELECGAGAQGEAYADSALRAYGTNSPAVPRLAFDLAYYWILRGRFAEALRVARALVPHFDAPADIVLVYSMIARAAGGVRNSTEFTHSVQRLEAMLSEGKAEDSAAGALLGVAYGAASMQDWELAERYAVRALRCATDRRESKITIAAESLLESIRQRGSELAPAGSPPAFHLADRFVAALEATGPAMSPSER